MLKKRKNPKFKFTNERLRYFMKFTIQHVIYVIKQSVSPKMFTNESLFTIQRLLYQDSTASEISISSLNHVILRPTKTLKLADKKFAEFY